MDKDFVKLSTMQGLGDAIASRPAVAAWTLRTKVFLQTPWPEVFVGLDEVYFVKPPMSPLRWQQKNIDQQRLETWHEAPPGLTLQMSYQFRPGCDPIPVQIAHSVKMEPEMRAFHYPGCGPSERGRLAIFRQPTERTEYFNRARNPEGSATARVLSRLGGMEWLHVNNLCDAGERLAPGECPVRTAEAVEGEFSLPTLLRLIQGAACVVTPVSWLAWAGAFMGTPTLCVMGGFAGPRVIFGEELPRPMVVVHPDPFCECFDPNHHCSKRIPDGAIDRAIDVLRELVEPPRRRYGIDLPVGVIKANN